MKEMKMVATTMSVTRALVELKRLDDKILRATQQGTYVAVSVGTGSQAKVHNKNGSIENVNSDIQSSFDTVFALSGQRSAIKSAIVKSNAETEVKVSGKTITVAEAIELKRSIELKRNLLRVLQAQYNAANAVVASLNAAVEVAIEANLKTVYGSEKSKVDSTTYDLIAKPQKAAKEASLIDPQRITDKIKALEEEISVVDSELDYTLSEINSRTDIVFDGYAI
jgi:hypothetical protein